MNMKESNKQFYDVKASLHTEALKLADELESLGCSGCMDGTNMIRRLVEELDKKGSSIWDSFREVYENCQCDSCKNKEPQTKPLSDEEIGDCVDDYFGLMALQHKYIYDIDQVQEYGLKLAREILRKAQEK